MTLADAIVDLLRHMEWADALIWKTVLSSPAAAVDSLLLDRLYHVHVTQHGFLQVWRGVSEELPPRSSLDSNALARWARAFYVKAKGISEFDQQALDRHVPESLLSKAEARLGCGAATPAILDTILQVVTHTIHHRGQISTRLRELGCEPPLTEYFVWVWRGKPAAEWCM
ncbi:MAG TPA: DinB family protein [Blastocatellia bacterium]|nr:DinB family protein [Blastocatellia bacterium]